MVRFPPIYWFFASVFFVKCLITSCSMSMCSPSTFTITTRPAPCLVNYRIWKCHDTFPFNNAPKPNLIHLRDFFYSLWRLWTRKCWLFSSKKHACFAPILALAQRGFLLGKVPNFQAHTLFLASELRWPENFLLQCSASQLAILRARIAVKGTTIQGTEH